VTEPSRFQFLRAAAATGKKFDDGYSAHGYIIRYGITIMVMILYPAEGNIVARIRMGETGVVVVHVGVCVSTGKTVETFVALRHNRKWVTEAVIARLSNSRLTNHPYTHHPRRFT
jgi:hypothetical protein